MNNKKWQIRKIYDFQWYIPLTEQENKPKHTKFRKQKHPTSSPT